jgi:hypothetical protein
MLSAKPANRPLSLELGLYAGLFALALGLRLFRLGLAPLNDFEAAWALQALELARQSDLSSLIGPQPLYVLFTSLLLNLSGFSGSPANGLARLLPALAGSLLVWLPYLALRAGKRPEQTMTVHWRNAGLLAALGLALDPSLTHLSRLAGSDLPAVSFGLLALAVLMRRPLSPAAAIWGGILAALALLSGPSLLQGALILALTAALSALLPARNQPQPDPSNAAEDSNQATRYWLPATLSALLLLGTGFGLAPQLLGGLAETPAAWLGRWSPAIANDASTPAFSLIAVLLALLVYHALPLWYGLSYGLLSWLRPSALTQPAVRLLIAAAIALLLVLLQPGRQLSDLAWALIPLWGLTGLALAHLLELQAGETSGSSLATDDQLPATDFNGSGLIAAGLIFFTGLLGSYNLVYLVGLNAQPWIFAAVLGGVAAIGAILALLVFTGWNERIAVFGLGWGLAALLALYSFSNLWGLSFVRFNGPTEIWRYGPPIVQAQELEHTLALVSRRSEGHLGEVRIISSVSTPAMRWLLSRYPAAAFANDFSSDQLPPIYISPAQAEKPELLGEYRGMDLHWSQSPAWQGPLPPDWLRWLLYRRGPVTPQSLIIWVRSDLFSGAAP